MSIEKTSSQRPGGVTSSVRQPSATSQVSAWLKQHKLGQIYVQESFGHTTYYLQGEGKVSVREEYLHLNLAWLAKKVEGGWENAVGANLNQRYYLGVFGNNIGPTVSSCTDQQFSQHLDFTDHA